MHFVNGQTFVITVIPLLQPGRYLNDGGIARWSRGRRHAETIPFLKVVVTMETKMEELSGSPRAALGRAVAGLRIHLSVKGSNERQMCHWIWNNTFCQYLVD